MYVLRFVIGKYKPICGIMGSGFRFFVLRLHFGCYGIAGTVENT